MALQLRRFSAFTSLRTVAPSRVSPPMLHNRTMQCFSCNFQPHSLFTLGVKLGKPIHLSTTNISINMKDRIRNSICSDLRIQTFCSRRSPFESGNGPRLNLLAHGHVKMRSFSSKSKRKFKFQAKSKEACDGAAGGGDMTRDGHSALREHHGPKKRDKSMVCNSINGQINAAVSNPKPSVKKGTAKTNMSVSNTVKDVDGKNRVIKNASGNKGATKRNANVQDANMPPSNTGKDAKCKENVIEDSSGNKGVGNDNVQDANTPVRRNRMTRNKKQDGRTLVQANICNESTKMNGKVQGAKTLAEMNQRHENDKQDQELSSSPPAAAETESSNKLSKENTQSVNGASCLTKSNSADSSIGDFNIQKQIRPLYPPSGKSVVVVESLTKARVIQTYLGNMYEVLPSHGHLRDLAGRSGSVRPDDDFSMVWEVPASAWTHLKSIKLALNGVMDFGFLGGSIEETLTVKDSSTVKIGAENLILASDPDCEGEAIAWHVTEMLQQQDSLSKNITVARVVFNEITESAIKSALQSPREIDKNLVNAYLARRALDYLIGFNISPLLWKKLPGCQSAGRVQSAALALICDRELEIEKFNKKEYWTVGLEFHNTCLDPPRIKNSISSHLTHFNSHKLDRLSIWSHADAQEIEKQISSSTFDVLATRVSKVVKNPPMPYTTSTLQQDATNKLKFTASYTMKVAQGLYEGIKLSDGEEMGLITYIKTDGVHISDGAAKDVNSLIKERYGEEFVSKNIRRYFKKVKNAYEAHEAIRPSDIRRLPATLVGILDDDSVKLYTLIWTRTMECQMEPATIDTIQVDFGNMEGDMAFRSVASQLGFPGFQEVYKDSEAAATGSEEKEADVTESSFEVLRNLQVKDPLSLGQVELRQHYTKPPARYSEGTLVKKLEELGIGRPSTYASIMKVLQDRNYVTLKNRELYPDFRGRMVSAFLHHLFSEVADYSFTADVENELDNVSAGETEWRGLLKDYWSRFTKHCDLASNTDIRKVEKILEKTFSHFLFASIDCDSRTCPSCSVGTLRFKVIGSDYFIACDRYPKCKYTACTIYSEECDDEPSEQPVKSFPPKFLGVSPGSNEKIFLKNGPYGHYVQLGEDRKGYMPKRAPISEVKDLESITLEDAMELLRYPVSLGNHPDDEHPVLLTHSKFRFSIKHRRTVAPVPKNMDPKKITLATGLKLLSGKNIKQTGRPKSKPKPAEDSSWE